MKNIPESFNLDIQLGHLMEIVYALEKQGQRTMSGKTSEAKEMIRNGFLNVMRELRRQIQEKYPDAWKDLATNSDYNYIHHYFDDDKFLSKK